MTLRTHTVDKQVSFKIQIFNLKILPKEEEVYSDIFQRVLEKDMAFNTRSDKYMTIRSLSELADKSAIEGELIYFTRLNGKDWYNRRSKRIENVEIDPNLNPNAKIGEFYFIPKAHRFCLVLKSGGISPSQIKIFLEQALRNIYGEKEIVVEEETSRVFIDKIMKCNSIKRLHINITYTNDDLTDDFKKMWDDDLKQSNVGRADITANALKNEDIDLKNNQLLMGALQLSESNGYAEVQIKEGKQKKTYKTTEYPRVEIIKTTIDNKLVSVRDRILSIFR
jgi:hypothetical protein